MEGVLGFLNRNTGAVTALSALITAVATVAIAAFSYGTWRLYRLEKDRNLSFAQQLKQDLAIHATNCEFLASFYRAVKAEKDEVGRTFYDMIIMQAEEELGSLSEDLPHLKEAAERGYPDIMDTLLLAERKVHSLQRQLPELKRKLHLVSERDPDEIINEHQIDAFFASIGDVGEHLTRPSIVATEHPARMRQFMDASDIEEDGAQLSELLSAMKVREDEG